MRLDHTPYAQLRPIPKEAVKFQPGFWQERQLRNRLAVSKLYEALKEHGVMDNFKRVNDPAIQRRGPWFTDSDLYKWLEAACHVLPDPVIEPLAAEVVSLLLSAQGADGYLNTYFIHEHREKRFSDLENAHELYCAGHFIEAAIAHRRATGKEQLFRAAVRFADYLVARFGPGKIEKADGHPEIELALVELYRETGEKKYLELARFFLERINFRSQQEIQGHAVRAAYYAAGLADYYLETGDSDYLESIKRQWQNMVCEKIYITGGIGGRVHGESFGRPFELPHEGAYAETCAAIASIFWNRRMLHILAEGRFADLLERTLYNGFLAGVSLSGDRYFYVNPLAYNGQPRELREAQRIYERKPWHDCTCCPPNAQRLLASLGDYFYSSSREGLWVHLYDNTAIQWQIDGVPIRLVQRGNYPWEGDLSFQLSLPKSHEFSLFLRLPLWARGYSLKVDGVEYEAKNRAGYLEIRRKWRDNSVELSLELPTVLMEANSRLAETRGSVALMRGPLVYCLEQADNPNLSVLEARLDSARRLTANKTADLGGVVKIQGFGKVPTRPYGPLYRPWGSQRRLEDVELFFIPYYAWNNRDPGAMTVWLERG